MKYICIDAFLELFSIRLIYQKMSNKPEKLHKKIVVVYMLDCHNMWQIIVDGNIGRSCLFANS